MNSSRYRKLIILLVIVVVAGLMIGFILNFSAPELTQTTTRPQNVINEERISNDLVVGMSINPKEIEVAEKSLFEDKRPIEEINKSIVTVTYTNNSGTDLSETEVLLLIKGGKNYGFFTTATAKYIEREPFNSATQTSNTRFKIQDVKKGETQSAEIYIYSHVPDILEISAQVRSAQAISTITEASTLTIE